MFPFAPPPVRRDFFDANALDQVAAGQDMRFGPQSPMSMFRSRTVRSGPGQFTVHPMLPQTGGGPLPVQAAPLGTSQWDRNAGAVGWAQRHQSPNEGAIATVRGMQPSGEMSVQVQGFPRAPGQANGPGWAYMPGSQVAGLYNRVASQFPNMGLQQLQIDQRGGTVMDAAGNPLSDADVSRMMINARQQLRNSKIGFMRNSQRLGMATRAAQRGNYSPMAKYMQANQMGLFAGGQDGIGGVDPQQMFNMAMEALAQFGDNLPAGARVKFLSQLAGAMAQRGGHTQIPGLLSQLGDFVTNRKRFEAATTPTAPKAENGPIDNAVKWFFDTFPGLNPYPTLGNRDPRIVGPAPRRPAAPPGYQPQVPAGGFKNTTPSFQQQTEARRQQTARQQAMQQMFGAGFGGMW